MLRIVLLFSIIFAALSCGFQKLQRPPLQHVKAKNPKPANTGRSLQQATQNINIYADYSYLEGIDPIQQDYIKNQIMSSAISYYQTTLQIYGPSEGVLVDLPCGGYDPPSYLVDPGVDADLVIMVTAESLPDQDFVAGAIPCGISDTNNRPNYGVMLFNLAYLPIDKIVDNQENLSTALHELCHLFGFNPDIFPYFMNPTTGELLTDIVRTTQIGTWNITYLDVEPLTSRVRTYFNCPTLEGAYLEDEGDQGSAISHFERRVFMNEFMTASSIPEPVISQFTLAVLEGSGWYVPNYNMTEPFTFGQNQGCPFLDGPCVTPQGVPTAPEFCDMSTATFGCSYTSRGVAFCSQGNDPFADNCPYFAASTLTDCQDPTNQASAYIAAELYGPNSRCFTGTLVEAIYIPTAGAFCFPTTCTQNPDGTTTLTLVINGDNLVCSSAGPVTIDGYSGELDCPDPIEFCNRANPAFCRKGCSGRGTCVNNVCQCPPGWVGADCAERSFDPTCERCQDQPGTGCFGDLCITSGDVIEVGEGINIAEVAEVGEAVEFAEFVESAVPELGEVIQVVGEAGED